MSDLLADLVPGLREIRGPLAAGYLWLLFAWLLFDDDVEAADGAVSRLVDLGSGVSEIAVAIAASFAAYLIGSISEDLFGFVLALLVGRSLLVADRSRWLSIETSPFAEFRQWQADHIDQSLLPRTIAQLENTSGRLGAESSLRLSIAPPLVAIVAYLVVADSWWWIFLGFLVLAILVQAFWRARQQLITFKTLSSMQERLSQSPEDGHGVEARGDSEPEARAPADAGGMVEGHR